MGCTVIAAMTFSAPALANDTAFMYQGELKENGQPANGAYNMDFSLWDAETDGNLIGPILMLDDVPVVNGRFTVTLDFGPGSFDNTAAVS